MTTRAGCCRTVTRSNCDSSGSLCLIDLVHTDGTVTHACRLMDSGSYRLEDDDSDSHWLLHTDLLLLLLADLLSLVVVPVLSAGRRLLVVVLEAVGGLRLVGLSRLGLLLAGLPLLLADLGRLGGRADEGLEVAVLTACSQSRVTTVNTPSHCLVNSCAMMVDNLTMTL